MKTVCLFLSLWSWVIKEEQKTYYLWKGLCLHTSKITTNKIFPVVSNNASMSTLKRSYTHNKFGCEAFLTLTECTGVAFSFRFRESFYRAGKWAQCMFPFVIKTTWIAVLCIEIVVPQFSFHTNELGSVTTMCGSMNSKLPKIESCIQEGCVQQSGSNHNQGNTFV